MLSILFYTTIFVSAKGFQPTGPLVHVQHHDTNALGQLLKNLFNIKTTIENTPKTIPITTPKPIDNTTKTKNNYNCGKLNYPETVLDIFDMEKHRDMYYFDVNKFFMCYQRAYIENQPTWFFEIDTSNFNYCLNGGVFHLKSFVPQCD